MKANGPTWLDSIEIVDLFNHEENGAPKRAITFALQYSNHDGNRSADSVNQTSETLIQAVIDGLGERGVVLRA